jgi:uncharacterized membrane protein YbhN (UPF0104 family)
VRAIKTVCLLLGAALLGVLVYRVGAEPILETLGRLAWWQFVLVCLPYALTMAADTLGWRFAFARDRAPFWRLYGARLAGEALNVVTAVGAVGGEAAKAWLVRRDVSYEESVPSVVIAKTTITIAQALFLVLGLAVAWGALPPGSEILRGMLWLLLIEVLAVIGFPLLGWLLGVVEAMVVLWALGVDAPVAVATLIEALGSGVRFATFLVPASLGPFEAANAAAFAARGFGAGAGLAFSLVRRARQAVWVVVGIVALLAMRWAARREAAEAPRAA